MYIMVYYLLIKGTLEGTPIIHNDHNVFIVEIGVFPLFASGQERHMYSVTIEIHMRNKEKVLW